MARRQRGWRFKLLRTWHVLMMNAPDSARIVDEHTNQSNTEMKKVFAAVMLMVAMMTTANAQDNNTTTPSRREAFKQRSEVLADSIRAKAPRLGKRIADGTVVLVDSVGAKGERMGKKAMVVGDTMAVRTKKAWKVMKGEDATATKN